MNYIGESGNDTLTGSDANDVLVGNDGNDVLSGGAAGDILYGDGTDGTSTLAGNDTLNGDAGNDFLVGGAGIDQLNGGDGNDILIPGLASRVTLSGSYTFVVGTGKSVDEATGADFGSSFQETVNGGAGTDIAYLSFHDQTANIVFDNSNPAATNTVLAGGVGIGTVAAVERVVFYSGQGADVLRGADFSDVLKGGAGNDEIYGNAGSDDLYGDAGDDTLYGGAGNDYLSGGAGDDRIDGGDGIDTVDYDSAATVDLRRMGEMQNTGASGVDVLFGVENLSGSRSTDVFNGDDQANRLEDEDGGNDAFYGRGGDDTLIISRSTTMYTTPTGTRQYIVGSTNVTMEGGDGNDTLTFNGRTRYIDRASLISGGNGDDIISVVGMATATIDGGAGNDRVTVDGRGSDIGYQITLGAGTDTIALSYAASSTATLSTGTTVTDFVTGVGGDIIDIASLLTTNLFLVDATKVNPFGVGYLRLVQNGTSTNLEVDRDGDGAGGFITLLTLSNTDAASFHAFNLYYVTGQGTSGADTLTGSASFDRLLGLGGADVLDGGAGRDVLDGGDGADRLLAGADDDYLIGGSGIDTAVFGDFFKKSTVSAQSASVTVVGPD
ncbi:calcium-binding protein, partial [Sphingomonas sp. Leaf22]|uniref:calcium-binding protein n=1 Tax=Sphingomonas sp. Leaf22 TaxID=1735687 RepID=UPI000AB868AF